MSDADVVAWSAIDLRAPKRKAYAGGEHAFQRALVSEIRMLAGRMPALQLLHAIPNGGPRSKAAAGKLRAEGVCAGVPDLCLPVRGHDGSPGLYLELKVAGGSVSAEQRWWLLRLAEQGFRCAVVNDRESALWVIADHLGQT